VGKYVPLAAPAAPPAVDDGEQPRKKAKTAAAQGFGSFDAW
jgi:hypothetical protein